MAAGEVARFGALDDGTVVEEVTLRAGNLTARVMTYGATLRTLDVPDRDGHTADIVLGYATLAEYLARPQFFGATIGRYANRLRDGRFTLDGTAHQVPATDGPNALHGGTRGFDKHNWMVAALTDRSVTLRRTSPDGEEGFPGTLDIDVTYALTDDALGIHFAASTDRPTVVNLTNHTYFNLAGEGSGTALDHVVAIAADAITPVDATLIPTGAILPVAGTALDFRDPHPIAARIRDAGCEQLALARGYDHNFVLRGGLAPTPREAVQVREPTTGRVLTISTTEPGVQFYSGNFLDATTSGKSGRVYRQGDGIAFETQHFPDSPNHDQFPTTRLDPGATFRSTTIWRFFTSPSE
jgi:aldose 1-epimerase